jgi:hypothetical protein
MTVKNAPSPTDFAFIVGAPRCGTTSLASYLRQHPDVCFSSVKEPMFFAQHDLRGLDDRALRQRVEEEYLKRFFGECSGTERLRAEGSVTYLYVAEQLEPILRLWPNARFIVALRDPLAMLPSLHARLLYTGDENIMDFKKAWNKVPERAAGRSIPRSAIDPRFLRYDQAGAFGTRVKQLFDAVGRDRCHVVLFDDLVADSKGTYEGLCAFLGLEPWPGTKLKAQRKHEAFRFGWLQRLLKRPPKPMRTVLAGNQFRQREKKLDTKDSRAVEAILKIRKRLLNWNKVSVKREQLDPEVRQEIIDRLSGETILLSELIDRDLSHWLGGLPEANPAARKARRA